MPGGAGSPAPAGECSPSFAPPDRASCARALVGGGAVGAKCFAAVPRPAAGVGGVERPRRVLSGGAASFASVGEAVVCCPCGGTGETGTGGELHCIGDAGRVSGVDNEAGPPAGVCWTRPAPVGVIRTYTGGLRDWRGGSSLDEGEEQNVGLTADAGGDILTVEGVAVAAASISSAFRRCSIARFCRASLASSTCAARRSLTRTSVT